MHCVLFENLRVLTNRDESKCDLNVIQMSKKIFVEAPILTTSKRIPAKRAAVSMRSESAESAAVWYDRNFI